MAEAAVEQTPTAARFFCHQCAEEVRPVLPDYVCSLCHSGFIEELAQPPPENPLSYEDDMERTFAQISDALLRSFQANYGNARGQTRNVRWPPPIRNLRRSRPRISSQIPDPRSTRAEGFLNQLIQSLTENAGFPPNTNFPVFVNLPGNPGDYVWGRGGWNAVITQLINQLDGTGPPPMPKEKIDEIPTVQISQSQVDQNLQCTVCMEDFILDEPVRLLPCQHNFHNDCIIPWLQLHGTCPICRKLLMPESGQNPFVNDSAFALNVDPGPSGSHLDSSQTSQVQSDSNNSSTGHNNPSAYDFSDDWD